MASGFLNWRTTAAFIVLAIALSPFSASHQTLIRSRMEATPSIARMMCVRVL
jgi:hypothetical protein